MTRAYFLEVHEL